MTSADAGHMTNHIEHRTSESRRQSWLEIVWALVVLQGGVLVLAAIESLVVNAVFGFTLIAVVALTAAAAFLTLRTARGLRERRRWARRVTLVAEWFVLVFGVVEIIATFALAGSFAGLVPLVTGVLIPVTVLVFLRRTKPLFVVTPPPSEDVDDIDISEPTPESVPVAEHHPADDPILGTLV